MARYELKGDEFTQIAEESGVIVNISNAKVELSTTQEQGSGIVLYPKQSYLFSDTTLYATREAGDPHPAAIAVGPFPGDISGNEGIPDNEFATDEEVDSMLDSVFGS